MMPWSRCNCSSRRESGRAITVTVWPARASWYANVLPILPAPMTAIDKGDLAAGAIFFMRTSPLIRSHPVRGATINAAHEEPLQELADVQQCRDQPLC